jgi:hypothetical protein
MADLYATSTVGLDAPAAKASHGQERPISGLPLCIGWRQGGGLKLLFLGLLLHLRQLHLVLTLTL